MFGSDVNKVETKLYFIFGSDGIKLKLSSIYIMVAM